MALSDADLVRSIICFSFDSLVCLSTGAAYPECDIRYISSVQMITGDCSNRDIFVESKSNAVIHGTFRGSSISVLSNAKLVFRPSDKIELSKTLDIYGTLIIETSTVINVGQVLLGENSRVEMYAGLTILSSMFTQKSNSVIIYQYDSYSKCMLTLYNNCQRYGGTNGGLGGPIRPETLDSFYKDSKMFTMLRNFVVEHAQTYADCGCNGRSTTTVETDDLPGGIGAGYLYIDSADIILSGKIHIDGQGANPGVVSTADAPGGGAGGTISLRAQKTFHIDGAVTISANGGRGGRATVRRGYGGGGGRIFLRHDYPGGPPICDAVEKFAFAYGGPGPGDGTMSDSYVGGPGYIYCVAGQFGPGANLRVHVANDPAYGPLIERKHPVPALLLFRPEDFIFNFRYTFSNVRAVAIMIESAELTAYFAPYTLENRTPDTPVNLLLSRNMELCLESRPKGTLHSCWASKAPSGTWTMVGFQYFQRANAMLPMVFPHEFIIEGRTTSIGTQNLDVTKFPIATTVFEGTFGIVDRQECLDDVIEMPDLLPIAGDSKIVVFNGGTVKLGTNFLSVGHLLIFDGTLLISHDLPVTQITTTDFVCDTNCVVRAVMASFQCHIPGTGKLPTAHMLAGGSHAGCGAQGGCRDPSSPHYTGSAAIMYTFIGTKSLRPYNRRAQTQQRERDPRRVAGGLSLFIDAQYFENQGLISVKGAGATRDESKSGLESGRGAGGSLTIHVRTAAVLSRGVLEASGGEDEEGTFPSTSYLGASGGYITYYEQNPAAVHNFTIRNYGSQSMSNGKFTQMFGSPGITFLRCKHAKYINPITPHAGLVLVQGNPQETKHNSCLSCGPLAQVIPSDGVPFGLDLSRITVHFEGAASMLVPEHVSFQNYYCPSGQIVESKVVNSYTGVGISSRRLQASNNSTGNNESFVVSADNDLLASSMRRELGDEKNSCSEACYKYDTELLSGLYTPKEIAYVRQLDAFQEGNYFQAFDFIGRNYRCIVPAEKPEEPKEPPKEDPKEPPKEEPTKCPEGGSIGVSKGEVCEYLKDVELSSIDCTGKIIFHGKVTAEYIKVAYGGEIELRDGAQMHILNMIFMSDGNLSVKGKALIGGEELRIEGSYKWFVEGALFVDVHRFIMYHSKITSRTLEFQQLDKYFEVAPGSFKDGPNGGIYGGCNTPPCSWLNGDLKARPYGLANRPEFTGSPGYNGDGTYTAAGGLVYVDASDHVIVKDSAIIVSGEHAVKEEFCGGSGGAIYFRGPKGDFADVVLDASGGDGESANPVLHCPGGGGRIALVWDESFTLENSNLIASGGNNALKPGEVGPTGTGWIEVRGRPVSLTAWKGGQAAVVIDEKVDLVNKQLFSFLFERDWVDGKCQGPLELSIAKGDFASSKIASGFCVSLTYDTQSSMASAISNFRAEVAKLDVNYGGRVRQATYDVLKLGQDAAQKQKIATSRDFDDLSQLLKVCLATPIECEVDDCDEVEITPYNPVISFPPGASLTIRVRGVPRREGMTPKHGAFLQLVPHFFRSSYLLPRADAELKDSKVVGNSTHCTLNMKVPVKYDGSLCSDYMILYS